MARARVLLVDDERSIVDLYAKVLGRKGYDVLPTNSAREALEIVRCDPPVHVVLSDLTMPPMHGPELVREMAQISPETACVLMTGGSVEWLDVPPDVPLVFKPLSQRDLIQTIDNAIDRSIQLRARLCESTGTALELLAQAKRIVSETRHAVKRATQMIDQSRWNRRLHRKRYCRKRTLWRNP